MKRFFISFFIFVALFSTIVHAGTLVKKVYFSPYPIMIDQKEYSSETPILQYQDRTYVSLREFSEMVGVDVDFKNNTIIISTDNQEDNFKDSAENLSEKTEVEESKKEEIIINISKNELTENNTNEDSVEDGASNIRKVYVAKTGKKYHNISNCNNGNYSATTISEAIKKGYTPCLRCATSK